MPGEKAWQNDEAAASPRKKFCRQETVEFSQSPAMVVFNGSKSRVADPDSYSEESWIRTKVMT